MTETEVLADVIALSIHEATQPLLTKLAVLEAQYIALEAKHASTKDLFWTAIGETVSDLRARLIQVEARAPVPGPQGPPGERGEVGPKGADGMAGKAGTDGLHGKDGAPGTDGAEGLPGLQGKDGRDGLDGKDGEAGLNGKDGRDGLDGKDGAAGLHGKDGAAGLNGKDGTPGRDALPAKDGLGIKSAVVNSDGRLLLTLSNDETQDLGVVVGRPGRDGMPAIGRPGQDGTSVTVEDVRPIIHSEVVKAVQLMPKAVNGTDGRDGVDALGFDDLTATFDEQKGVQLVFEKGQRKKTFDLPVPFYAGVWTAGRLYPKGANVTIRGAIYIALEPTRTRPEDGSADSARAWRLAVKGGRDGKPGKDGKDGTDA